jgi:SAM-dependent methyltransferase
VEELIKTREELLNCILGLGQVLEIGPFDRPLLSGSNVSYLEALTTNEIRNRAKQIEGRDPENVPEIDFVGTDGVQKATKNSKFGAIVSAHLIEHQPDLIRHIDDILCSLIPDGIYLAIMPDKFECFDFFLSESEIPEILAAYYERHTKPGLRSVIEHRAFTNHNYSLTDAINPLFSPSKERVELIQNAVQEWQNSVYVDVHVWQFSKGSLYSVMEFIQRSGICSYRFEFEVEKRGEELELLIRVKNKTLDSKSEVSVLHQED